MDTGAVAPTLWRESCVLGLEDDGVRSEAKW